MGYEVVIPAYNECLNLPYVFSGLLRQRLPPNRIIVIDDASTDCTEKAIMLYLNRLHIKYIRLSRNIGKQNILNILFNIYKPTTEYVVLMDADVVPVVQIEEVLREMEKEGAKIAFLPYVVYPRERDVFYYTSKFAQEIIHYINARFDSFYRASGAFIVISSDIFNKIKLIKNIRRDDLFIYLYTKYHLRVKQLYYRSSVLLLHRKMAPRVFLRKVAASSSLEPSLAPYGPLLRRELPPLPLLIPVILKTAVKMPHGFFPWAFTKALSMIFTRLTGV